MADTTQSSLTRVSTLAPHADLRAYAQGWRLGFILLALFLVNVLGQIDRILPFILAESIKRDLALSDTQIGLLTGLAFAVCYTLLSLPLARAADRGSPRFVLVLCVVVWSAMTSLGGLAASFVFLAMTRFGVAFGEAGAMPAGHALIGRLVRPDRRGLAIGLFSMGIPIGTMLGFAAGGAIGDNLGWRVALIGAGALGGLIALFAFVAIGPPPSQPHAVVRSSHRGSSGNRKEAHARSARWETGEVWPFQGSVTFPRRRTLRRRRFLHGRGNPVLASVRLASWRARNWGFRGDGTANGPLGTPQVTVK